MLEPTNIGHVLVSGFHGNNIKSCLKNGRTMYTSFVDFYTKIIDSKSRCEAVHTLTQQGPELFNSGFVRGEVFLKACDWKALCRQKLHEHLQFCFIFKLLAEELC